MNTTCVLCNAVQESCNHLFFGCRYSGQIWKTLVRRLMQNAFTTDWNELIGIISNPRFTPTKAFILMYTFQATMHTLWWERNLRCHGEQPRDIHCLTKIVDKTVRLRLLSVKGKGHRYLDESLTTWFEFRQDP